MSNVMCFINRVRRKKLFFRGMRCDVLSCDYERLIGIKNCACQKMSVYFPFGFNQYISTHLSQVKAEKTIIYPRDFSFSFLFNTYNESKEKRDEEKKNRKL